MNKQNGDAYAIAIREIFTHVTKIHPSFKNGQTLWQIMVDFDQAEYNSFERSIGAELCEKILRGCYVHWKTSAKRVSDIVTKSKEEYKIFRDIGHAIQDLTNQTDFKLAFDVLCGVKNITEAKNLFPPDLAATCNQQTNVHWSQSALWVRWWIRERILKMFCKAYTLRDIREFKIYDATATKTSQILHI